MMRARRWMAFGSRAVRAARRRFRTRLRLITRFRTLPPIRLAPLEQELARLGPPWSNPAWRGKGYDERRRELAQLHADVGPRGMRYRGMRFSPKLAGYRLAVECGVSIPETKAESVAWASIVDADLPDRVVIKPVTGSTNRGVHVLERLDGGRWHDLLTGDITTLAALQRHDARLAADMLISPLVVIEEALRPAAPLDAVLSIPDDLKIFFFLDRPFVIMQRRLHGSPRAEDWRFAFWSADWKPLGPVRYRDRFDASLDPPAGGPAAVDAARLIAERLRLSQVRIDMYDTDRGPVFGEITPLPGAGAWIRPVDRMLGAATAWAAHVLDTEGVSDVEVRGARPIT